MYENLIKYIITHKVSLDSRNCQTPLKRCNFCDCLFKIGGSRRTINMHRIDLDIFLLLIHMQRSPLNEKVTADKTT